MVEPRGPRLRARREPGTRRDFWHLIPMVGVAVAFLLLWELSFRLEIWHPELFPSPGAVASSLLDLGNRGLLLRSTVGTLVRLGVGFLISLVLGALLAVLMVHFATFGKGLQPY